MRDIAQAGSKRILATGAAEFPGSFLSGRIEKALIAGRPGTMHELPTDGPRSRPTDSRRVAGRTGLPISWLRSIFVKLVLITVFAGSAQAQDMVCRKDDAFRRFQVLADDGERGLPCEVIAWFTPDEPRRIWRAEFEREFCTVKLREIVERLAANGWQCQPATSGASYHRNTKQRPVM